MTEDELKLIHIFKEHALSVSKSVLNEIQTIRLLPNGTLSFDELMKYMKDLEKTLTDKAVQLLQVYKKHAGHLGSDDLTAELKNITTQTLESTIKQL